MKIAFSLNGQAAEQFAALLRDHEGCACGQTLTANGLAKSLVLAILEDDAATHEETNVVQFVRVH